MRLYPIFAHFADSIQKGVVPLWDPYLEMGQPFFVVSPGMVSAWEPWSIALILLGKWLRVGLLYLFHLHLLLHFIVFATGAYCLFRRLFDNRTAAFAAFSTLVFSLLDSSYFSQLGYIVSYSLAPWMIFSLVKFLEDSDPNYLIAGAWLLGIAAESYHVLVTLTFLACLCLAIFFSKAVKSNPLRVAWRNKISMALAGCVFMLLAARTMSQFWYLKDMVLILRREVATADFSQWSDFATLVSPFFYSLRSQFQDKPLLGSMGALYIGLTPLWISLIGLIHSRHRYKKAFVIAAAVTTLLMLGPYTPFYAALKLLPMFQVIRNTTDFHIFFVLCLCFFVGCGIECVMVQVKRPAASTFYSFTWLVLAVAMVGVGVAAITRTAISVPRGVTYPAFAAYVQDAWRISEFAAGWFILGGALALAFLKRGKMETVLVCLFFFSLTDVLFAGQTFLTLWTQNRSAVLPEIPQSVLTPDHYVNRRTPTIRSSHLFNVPTLFRESTAYHPDLSSYISFSGAHFVELKDSDALSQAALINDRRRDNRFKPRNLPRWADRAMPMPPLIDVAAGVSADKLRLVRSAVIMDHAAILQAMKAVSPKELLNFIYLEEDLPGEFKSLQTSFGNASRAHPISGHIEVGAFESNRMSLIVDAPADCLLYYSDAYHDSWQAYVDDVPSKIFRANYNFKAVPLPRGMHRVHFEYHPSLYLWSLWLYAAGIFAGIWYFIWSRADAAPAII